MERGGTEEEEGGRVGGGGDQRVGYQVSRVSLDYSTFSSSVGGW